MSEVCRYTGKVKLMPKQEGEDLEAQCKRIYYIKDGKNNGYVKDYIEEIKYEYYDKYVIVGEDLYEVIDLEEGDSEDTRCTLIREADGVYIFDTTYYDGSTHLTEVLSESIQREEGAR